MDFILNNMMNKKLFKDNREYYLWIQALVKLPNKNMISLIIMQDERRGMAYRN